MFLGLLGKISFFTVIPESSELFGESAKEQKENF